MTATASVLTEGFFLKKFEEFIRDEVKKSIKDAKRDIEAAKAAEIASCRAEIEAVSKELASKRLLVNTYWAPEILEDGLHTHTRLYPEMLRFDPSR
jgi:hypothetical protein